MAQGYAKKLNPDKENIYMSIKPIGMLFFVGMALTSSAYVAVRFAGNGDDKYMDGTPLLAGECYAMVWQSDRVPFAGFRDDCTPVDPENCKIVKFISAKNGLNGAIVEYGGVVHCGEYKAALSFETQALFNDGGTLYLYAFDTRVKYCGRWVLSEFKNGKPTVLNAYGMVRLSARGYDQRNAGPIELVGMTQPIAYYDDSYFSVQTGASARLTEVAVCSYNGEFSSVEVKNGVVTLSVKNTSPDYFYEVLETSERSIWKLRNSSSWKVIEGSAKQGDEEKPIVWTFDAGKESGLYKLSHWRQY